MAMGRLWRRSAPGAIVAIVAATAGCRWVPLRRPDAATVPTPSQAIEPVATAAPVAVSMAPPAELPQLPPLRPISDEEALKAAPPTELLDAGAALDQSVKKAIAEYTPSPPSAIPPEAGPTPTGAASPERVVEPPQVEPARPRPFEVPADPAATWKKEVERLQDLARRNARAGGDLGETWSCREKVLASLADSADPSLWQTVLTALATPPNTTEPAEEPTPAPPLPTISDLRICRKVIGFGKTEPLAADALKPGQEILVYCEVEGLGFEVIPDGFRSRLASKIEIVRAADSGGKPSWTREFPVEDRCRRRRRDFFLNYDIVLPADLDPGQYEVRLVQKDLVADREAVLSVPITVVR